MAGDSYDFVTFYNAYWHYKVCNRPCNQLKGICISSYQYPDQNVICPNILKDFQQPGLCCSASKYHKFDCTHSIPLIGLQSAKWQRILFLTWPRINDIWEKNEEWLRFLSLPISFYRSDQLLNTHFSFCEGWDFHLQWTRRHQYLHYHEDDEGHVYVCHGLANKCQSSSDNASIYCHNVGCACLGNDDRQCCKEN